MRAAGAHSSLDSSAMATAVHLFPRRLTTMDTLAA
jgi:hypothetical protein